MLPTTDLLPLDFSVSATQVIDNKANLSPSLDLEATFSDLMREPLVAEQAALADLVGEELPPGGSQLPLELLPEQADLFANPESAPEAEIIAPVSPQFSATTQPLPVAVPIPAPTEADPLPPVDDAHLPLSVVNPAPTEVRADERTASIDFRRQRSAIDPFARQPLIVENGQDRMRTAPDEATFLERTQPLREFQQETRQHVQRASIEVNPLLGEKTTPEISSNLAINGKVEGGETNLKPSLPFNGIATNGAPIDTSQIRQPSPAAAAPASTIATTIDVPVMSKAWGNALQDRVMWMTGRGIQNAEIRLNPAELGPIRVQVTVENDVAQLAFSAQHAITRDAIEQAMPRLREMLSENGLSLSDSTVSDSDNPDVNQDQSALDRVVRDDGEPAHEEGLDISSSPIREPHPTALIDTFA